MSVKEWFPHDYHATRDVKLMRLIRHGGASYYGMYWHVVEVLHYTPTANVDDIIDALQVVLRVDPDTARDAIKLMTLLGLFAMQDNGSVKCERVDRNIQARQEVSNRRKEAAAKRWNANPMQQQSKSNANAMPLHNITEQNNTVNTKVVRTSVRDARPSGLPEVVLYFAELGMPAPEAQRFVDYYTANGWKVGRNTMKDWKAASRNWRKGWQDKQTKQGDTTARTAPRGLPAQVVEIANRPKLAASDVEAFKQAYLTKVTPSE